VSDVTTASNSTTATDFTSIAGIVIRGRRAESPVLADGLLMQPIRNPTPILSLSDCSVWIGRIRHRANKQVKALLVFRDEGVES
jgi:hypothetical protein